MARARAKRVYEPRSKDDGLRVLVMRLWPRGIRKQVIDVWMRELGADVANIRAWKAGRLSWPEMKRRYLRGLGRPQVKSELARLKALARRRTVTILCSCHEEARCHRSILKSLLNRA